jgi:hypothetical protein
MVIIVSVKKTRLASSRFIAISSRNAILVITSSGIILEAISKMRIAYCC